MTDIKEYKLKPGGIYALVREDDKLGDSGSMLVSFKLDKQTNNIIHTDNGVIKVGYNVRCGSHAHRSYSIQDYWITTTVTEIMYVSEEKVTFRTKNSVYNVYVHD